MQKEIQNEVSAFFYEITSEFAVFSELAVFSKLAVYEITS
jgi:hypothetical protein